jgi:tetratricopeptide (TPR) repeat protein
VNLQANLHISLPLLCTTRNLAVIIVGGAIPGSTQREYWIMQQHLMPHVDCCYWWIDSDVAETNYLEEDDESQDEEIATSSGGRKYLVAVHAFGNLYAVQGKLAEAEMYLRALKGYEKTLSAEDTSTLATINNSGNLYRDQGKLAEAEEMYLRTLKGQEKALGAEHPWRSQQFGQSLRGPGQAQRRFI